MNLSTHLAAGIIRASPARFIVDGGKSKCKKAMFARITILRLQFSVDFFLFIFFFFFHVLVHCYILYSTVSFSGACSLSQALVVSY